MPADAQVPDEDLEAAIRTLMRCPDVPEHAHVSMRLLTSMADDLGGDWRSAIEVAYAAGKREALAGARIEYAIRRGKTYFTCTTAEAALYRAEQMGWDAVERDVVETEWRAVQAGETP